MSLYKRVLSYVLILLCVAFGTPRCAQELVSISTLALYGGQDREQRMLQGARREGSVNVYTSLAVQDITELAAAFEKKYGIKVKYWRSAQDKILQRVVSETRAGRFDFDVLQTNDAELEALVREKLLARATSPYDSDLLPGAIRPHRQWVGVRLSIIAQAYNTKLVRDEDRPKTYQDLLDPKWKGKLALEAAESDWFGAVVREMGEERGLKLFRDIAATNGLSARKGHTLLAGLIASGDVPFALSAYNHGIERLKRQGAPINWYMVQPSFGRLSGLAISKAPASPHAAVLFYDFMLSPEAQTILQKAFYVPTNLKLNDPFTKLPFKLIDPVVVLDESAKWEKLYQEILTSRPK